MQVVLLVHISTITLTFDFAFCWGFR